jgi:hypothetical protein
MPKSEKSKSETAAAAAGTRRKTTKSERASNGPRDPKQLAEAWGLKIEQDKKAAEQGKRALAEIIIPYFNLVQGEFASEDFSFGVSQLKDQKPVRVHFRLGSGLTVAISATSEGVFLERSDGPRENITKKINVEAPAQIIENIIELITAFMERKT